jgi:hypothetical protein
MTMDRKNSISVRRNRVHLANDTATYYKLLSLEAREEENSLAECLARAAKEIEFDRES